MLVAFWQHPRLIIVVAVSAIACPNRGSKIVRISFPDMQSSPWGTMNMNPRLAEMAAFCREVALPAAVLAWIAAFGSAGIDSTGAALVVERPAPLLIAVTGFADKLPPVSLAAADAVAAVRSATQPAAAEATPPSHDPEPIVTAALTDLSESVPPEASPEPLAKSPPNRQPGDAGAGSQLNRSHR